MASWILKTSKGQALSVDVVLALLVFAMLFSFAYSHYWNGVDDLDKKNGYEHMLIRADTSANILMGTQGMPADWELSPQDANYAGLAFAGGNISAEKLAAFFALPYADAKKKIGLGEFDFFFSFEGQQDLNAGVSPPANAQKVVRARSLDYNGGVAIGTLTVYTSG